MTELLMVPIIFITDLYPPKALQWWLRMEESMDY